MALDRKMAVALAATLAVSAWVATQPDEDTVPAVAPRATVAGRAAAAPVGVDRSPLVPARARAAWPEPPEPVLLAWGPPPTPPAAEPVATPVQRPAVPVAAAPRAPEFPYALIGRFEDEHGQQALLAGPLKTLGARADDVIDGQWRVDQVLPAGVTLTWLPGKLQQTLNYRPS